jgi:LAO/AO transport system kinase
VSDLAARVMAGETRAAARLCRLIDDRTPGYRDHLLALAPARRAFTIGVTGSPGAGKSTLVDALIFALRKTEPRVGVVCVDPSSPFTGGAILGDRIRMQRHFVDPDVFIRSVATRGALGGLSRSARDIARVLEAWGATAVIVETVGVGQAEIDVTLAADTTAVVVAPGLGDDVQANKAGLL